MGFDSKLYLRAYYAAHRVEAVAYARQYRAANAEAIAARRAASRVKSPEKNRAKCAAYAATHRDEKRIYNANYHAKNREKIAPRSAANLRAWLAAHPGQGSAYMNARRALKRGNGGSHTLTEWRAKCVLFGNKCAYCSEVKPLTRDHDIPLSRGGTDDIDNIVPSCRSCNSRKLTKTASEFRALL